MKRFLKSQSALAIFAVNTQLGKKEQEYVEKAIGAPVKRVQGSYKGQQETSYVALWGGSYSADVAALCQKHNQESILILNRPKNHKRTANLFFLADGKLEAIGTLKHATVDQAMLHDGWTKDGGDYYVVE